MCVCVPFDDVASVCTCKRATIVCTFVYGVYDVCVCVCVLLINQLGVFNNLFGL